MEKAKKYIAEGSVWVVDCDLEKFFDRVNHDILMGRLAKRIEDMRLLKLIRRYLQAGVMIHGVVQERWEGTPQGGPLSPLLSNLLLDELDREFERRGHRFCRYADDCNVYVKAKRAGQRVFDSIEQFLWKRLKLQVNREKSAVAPCHERSFHGFSFTKGKVLKIKLSSKALWGVKHRIKAISRRSQGASLEQMIQQLTTYLKGWMQYYRLVETSTVFRDRTVGYGDVSGVIGQSSGSKTAIPGTRTSWQWASMKKTSDPLPHRGKGHGHVQYETDENGDAEPIL